MRTLEVEVIQNNNITGDMIIYFTGAQLSSDLSITIPPVEINQTFTGTVSIMALKQLYDVSLTLINDPDVAPAGVSFSGTNEISTSYTIGDIDEDNEASVFLVVQPNETTVVGSRIIYFDIRYAVTL